MTRAYTANQTKLFLGSAALLADMTAGMGSYT